MIGVVYSFALVVYDSIEVYASLNDTTVSTKVEWWMIYAFS